MNAKPANTEGANAMSKTLKLMMNLIIFGVAIGRTYALWQQRVQQRRRNA
jgi:hypothetical protein